jgi:hypothetical protein
MELHIQAQSAAQALNQDDGAGLCGSFGKASFPGQMCGELFDRTKRFSIPCDRRNFLVCGG